MRKLSLGMQFLLRALTSEIMCAIPPVLAYLMYKLVWKNLGLLDLGGFWLGTIYVFSTVTLFTLLWRIVIKLDRKEDRKSADKHFFFPFVLSLIIVIVGFYYGNVFKGVDTFNLWKIGAIITLIGSVVMVLIDDMNNVQSPKAYE